MKYSLGDGIVTGITGVFVVFLFWAFVSDLNALTSHGDEPALGTITFKKQTATRRSAHSQVWERLRNQSPVYQSDTLRTAEDSEAVVNFDDGLNLDLQQNTMLRLTLQGQTRNVDFTEGSVTIQGGGKGSVSLGQSGRTVTLSADAQLLLTKKADTMSLELSQGTASVMDAGGHEQALSPTQALDVTKDGEVVVRSVDLVPRSPGPGGKLVNLSESRLPVEFVYQIADSAKIGGVVTEVEVSDRPDFSTIVAHGSGQISGPQGQATLHRISLPLDPGTWFWRVSAGAEVRSTVRQFTLIQEAVPVPASPPDKSEVSYRKRPSPVAFSWTARDLVTAWTFEVARTRDFKTPQVRKRTSLTSLSVEGLEAGTWFWRVVPQYQATIISPPEEARISTLSVVHREAMAPLEPLVPVEGTTVQTQELATKGLAFTWEPTPEAASYLLEAHASASPSSATLAKFSATTPYLVLAPGQLGSLVHDGLGYWALRWVDDEGNLSPVKKLRTINAVDGLLALRPTYPPDGYKIADQFMTNTRFAWKSNLALKTVFQVARDPKFTEVVFEDQAQGGTRLGKDWGTGKLYWRLTSYNANGSVFLQTDPRRIEVAEPFPPVRLTEPVPGTPLLLPEADSSFLAWPPIAGADYYRVSLLEDNGAREVRYQTEVEQIAGNATNRLEVPFGTLPEGPYLARVQAFARENLLSTSVIGLYGDNTFEYRRLSYPRLIRPQDGTSIDGLDARRRGITFEWTTPTLPPDARIEVSHPDGTLAWSSPSTGANTSPPRFPEGAYFWTVRGTVQGFDLAARNPNRFTVLPVPRLAAAMDLVPPDGTVFKVPDLKGKKTFDLSWAPVPQAQVYLLRLFRDQGSKPVFETTVPVPGFSIEKGKFLQKGTFSWSVEGRTLADDGSIEQEGRPAQARFTIDIPAIVVPKLPTDQSFYGR